VVETSPEEWDAVIETNLRGPFLLCQAVSRQTIERTRYGKVININSGVYKSVQIGAS